MQDSCEEVFIFFYLKIKCQKKVSTTDEYKKLKTKASSVVFIIYPVSLLCVESAYRNAYVFFYCRKFITALFCHKYGLIQHYKAPSDPHGSLSSFF